MKEGDKITFKCEIISDSGLIRFEVGQQAIIRELDVTPSYYGAGTGQFYPEKLLGVKLEGYTSTFLPTCFYENDIDSKVIKVSIGRRIINKRKFKSGQLINTVKSVITHPILKIPTYTFHEDESYVECRRCELVGELKPHQLEIIRKYTEDNKTIVITAEQGLGKANNHGNL